MFKKKERSIAELHADLEREMLGAKQRKERNDLESQILKWQKVGKKEEDHTAGDRMKKVAKFVASEISFMGNNVRENIKEKDKGKKSKNKKEPRSTEWDTV